MPIWSVRSVDGDCAGGDRTALGDAPVTAVTTVATVVVGVGALLGAVAGLALPLAAYRLSVPWRASGEPAVPARGDCGHCDAPLPAGAAGWLRFGAACPACRARLGPRAWLLGLVAAAACAGLAWRLGPDLLLVPYLLAAVLGVLIGAVDLAAQRIPDVLILPGIGAAAALFGAVALATGAWGAYGRALLAGVALALGYAALALLPGASLGGGDVVLAGFLGICLGWFGWPTAVAGILLLPWLLQAPAALYALVVARAGRRAMLPFGPAMLAGAYLAVVGPPVLSVILSP